MTTQFTPILKLALPVTGELSGTWGDVVNDNITSMIEQAIAGLATISTWSTNSHTLSTANGTSSESRCAMVVAQDGAGLSAAGEIICPASSKLYVLQNTTSYAITLKTASGTGVAVASGETAFLFCDGVNVNSCVTTIVNGHVTGNLTVDGNATVNGNTTLGNATSDTVTMTARVASSVLPSADNTYDLGSTANSWKNLYIDGTAAIATLNLTNALTTANGGTGLSSWTAGDLPYYASGTALSKLGIGTSGQVLTSNGSAPSWTTLSSIGVTTFSAGTTGFTPSTATSGAVTLSGTLATTNGGTGLTSFTANGVVYASSTSALTTGSALTFDGTNFATTGNITGNNFYGPVGGFTIGGNNTNARMVMYPTSGYIAWYDNSSEAMRLTSTGLGIGTSSPGAKLDIGGTNNSYFFKNSGATTGYSAMLLQNSGVNLQFGVSASTGAFWGGGDPTTYFATIGTGTASTLTLATNSVSRVFLDSSGNLGLGVTPSGWGSSYSGQLQLASGKTVAFAGTQGSFWTNAYIATGGAATYATTAAAASYYQNAGQHIWFTAPSGTAGTAITFTQAMTLDASGNLLVGTTTPITWPGDTYSGTGLLTVKGAGEQNVTVGTTDTNYTRAKLFATSSAWGVWHDGSALKPFVIGGYSSTWATIDTSGNLGLGVTPNTGWATGAALQLNNGIAISKYGFTQNLYVDGTNYRTLVTGASTLYQPSGGQHVFYNASSVAAGGVVTLTQAMTLDASGNLGIGTTSPSGRLHIATGGETTSRFDGSRGSVDNLPVVTIPFWNVSNGVGDKQIATIGVLTGTSSNQTQKGQIYFSTSDGTLTERARIDSSGNFGIGTSSPTAKLDVNGAALSRLGSGGVALCGDASPDLGFVGYNYYNVSGTETVPQTIRSSWRHRFGNGATNVWSVGYRAGSAAVSAWTEYLTLDSSGNLGLGVTPSGWTGTKAAEFGFVGNAIVGYAASDMSVYSNAYIASGSFKYANSSLAASRYSQVNGIHSWYTAPSGTAGNPITFTQAMTLDASGNLLVGTTDTSPYNNSSNTTADNGAVIAPSNLQAARYGDMPCLLNRTGNDGAIQGFYRSGSSVGTISVTTTGTAYNTSSDYRLKNITGPITNSGAYIDSLNPVEGTWKADGSTFVGLIAHEVQEVSRTNVATGVKDGPEMQSMDYSSSEIIANLIAEVKSLRARIAAAGIA